MAPTSSMASKKSNLSYLSTERDQFVAVDVGRQRGRFYVQKALLTEHSEYFQKALSGPWQEAAESLVTLDDVRPATFHAFVEWLDTTEISEMIREDPSDDEEEDYDDANDRKIKKQDYEDTDGDEEDCWCDESYSKCGPGCDEKYVTSLVQAYTFGDRILAPLYKHAVLDQLLAHMWDGIKPTWFRAIAHAYENLPEDDPMQRALIDIHCRYWTAGEGVDLSKEKKEQAKLVPAIFWLWTSNVLADMAMECPRSFWGQMLDPCDYHDHARPSDKARKECKEHREAGFYDYSDWIPYKGPRPTLRAS